MSDVTWEMVEVPEGKMLFKIEADGKRWAIPQDPANADYQAYLNKDTVPSNSADPAEKPKK